MTGTTTTGTFEFKTEVKKLLHIITHSLYTHREIFIRELVSNASDALDKLRFMASRGDEVEAPDLDLDIRVYLDKDAGLLVVEDTGVGMTRDELVENIGTIARSGSEEFLAGLADSPGDAANIIGRFGVGFYSVFMCADQVTVKTRSCKPGSLAWQWRSDGGGSFEVEPLDPDKAPARGTRVEARLRDDAKEYLEPDRVRQVIKKHSGFLSFPILVEGDKVNTIPALWREPKFQVKPEQYAEFYTFLTFDSAAPLDTLHVSVDAPVQFNALAFVPSQANPLAAMDRDRWGLDLYVRRVLIQRENKDLVPEYLGFLKGVVDTEDLPLNISRESLQENALVRKISQTLTKQVLAHLAKMAQDKPEDYVKFWKAHAKVFKLGYADFANQDAYAPLLRFNSSVHDDAEGLASLDEYVARAKEGQKAVYFASGASREAVKLNPHLEIFRDKGVEVLYLFEPIDEFLMDALRRYKDLPLTSVETADLAELDAFESQAPDKDKAEELSGEDQEAMSKLLDRMKAVLGDRVTEVRLSRRLKDSPCCLVSPDGGMSSSMQKIMQIVTRDASIPAKAMEVNQDHALVRNLLRLFKADPGEEHLRQAVEQMFEASLLLEGYLADPHAMVERTMRMLEKSSGWLAEIKGV